MYETDDSQRRDKNRANHMTKLGKRLIKTMEADIATAKALAAHNAKLDAEMRKKKM